MPQRHPVSLTKVELEFMGIGWRSPEVTTDHIQSNSAARPHADRKRDPRNPF
jgi:hypothetical protein